MDALKQSENTAPKPNPAPAASGTRYIVRRTLGSDIRGDLAAYLVFAGQEDSIFVVVVSNDICLVNLPSAFLRNYAVDVVHVVGSIHDLEGFPQESYRGQRVAILLQEDKFRQSPYVEALKKLRGKVASFHFLLYLPTIDPLPASFWSDFFPTAGDALHTLRLLIPFALTDEEVIMTYGPETGLATDFPASSKGVTWKTGTVALASGAQVDLSLFRQGFATMGVQTGSVGGGVGLAPVQEEAGEEEEGMEMGAEDVAEDIELAIASEDADVTMG